MFISWRNMVHSLQYKIQVLLFTNVIIALTVIKFLCCKCSGSRQREPRTFAKPGEYVAVAY